MEQNHLLQMQGITKIFPGVKALSGVDFTLRTGEIHALMGENGAGKSTLIKVLTGVYTHDDGAIILKGKQVSPRSPQHAQSLGISTVYQEVNLIPGLSVAENIYLGRQPVKLGRLDWKRINAGAVKALKRLEITLDVTRPLDSYSIAIQQMVAIARAVDVDAHLLVLDEPTSSLDTQEVQHLFRVMNKLKSEGMGIVFVTHFMDQVYEVSDRITVLRNGQLVGEFVTSELPRIELIAHMMGREVEEINAMSAQHQKVEATGAAKDNLLLSATGIGRKGSIQPFDLDIHRGEVVGLAGLLGSGRTEMANLVFGIDQPDTGKVSVNAQPVKVRDCRTAIGLGMGFCPEDRKANGIIPNLSIRENIMLVVQAKRGWLRRISDKKQHELADYYIKALNIATPDAEKPIKLLSGGNQQKALLGRWLASDPSLLILDEPTRGIDVGAKFEIARLIEELSAKGMSVLFISSELEEVVRSSHRVVVLRDRKKVGELHGSELSESAIMNVIASKQDAATPAADRSNP